MTTGTRLLSTSIASLVLAAAMGAQTTQAHLYKATGPVGRVHYDLATGTVTKLVRPRSVRAADLPVGSQQASRGGLLKSFNNTLSSGSFTSLPGNSEFIDWAAKDTAGAFVSAVRFSYGTLLALPSLELALYEGTAGGPGICTLGAEITRLSFVGLPGISGTGGTSSTGFGSVYEVTATLATAIFLPDGPIGWGYRTPNLFTGPILTDFGTNTGWEDSFQWWRRSPASSGSCVGFSNFGGCSTGSVPPPGTFGIPCASFFLGLIEYVPGLIASCTLRNAGNPPRFVVTNPPHINETFSAATVTPIAAMVVTTGPLPGTVLSGRIQGVLLCNPATILGSIQVVTNGLFSIPIPRRVSLEGTAICVQAAEAIGPGTFQLTNAYDCVIGG